MFKLLIKNENGKKVVNTKKYKFLKGDKSSMGKRWFLCRKDTIKDTGCFSYLLNELIKEVTAKERNNIIFEFEKLELTNSDKRNLPLLVKEAKELGYDLAYNILNKTSEEISKKNKKKNEEKKSKIEARKKLIDEEFEKGQENYNVTVKTNSNLDDENIENDKEYEAWKESILIGKEKEIDEEADRLIDKILNTDDKDLNMSALALKKSLLNNEVDGLIIIGNLAKRNVFEKICIDKYVKKAKEVATDTLYDKCTIKEDLNKPYHSVIEVEKENK